MTADIVIVSVIAAALFFGIRGMRRRLRSGCCGIGEAAPKKLKVQDRNYTHYCYEARLSIDGMMCQNCCIHVENSLNSLEGVWAQADLGTKTVKVLMIEKRKTRILEDAVQGVGYQVTGVSWKSLKL